MSTPSIEVSEDQIAALARKFWEEEGQPEGKAEEHWARAEEQLRSGNGSDGNPERSADEVR
jgi:F0F1-type ATP synthase epsilon subunit